MPYKTPGPIDQPIVNREKTRKQLKEKVCTVLKCKVLVGLALWLCTSHLEKRIEIGNYIES